MSRTFLIPRSPFRNHFIEYLCVLVRENGVDPVAILSTIDLETVIRRANRRLPVRPYFFRHDTTLSDSIFHRELLKVHQHILIRLSVICFSFFRSHSLPAITNKKRPFIQPNIHTAHERKNPQTRSCTHQTEYISSNTWSALWPRRKSIRCPYSI